MPVMSHSWNASVPIRCVRTWPVMHTSGAASIHASAIGVTRFVAPGPEVAIATRGVPTRGRTPPPCGLRPARGGRGRGARWYPGRTRRRWAGSRRPGSRRPCRRPPPRASGGSRPRRSFASSSVDLGRQDDGGGVWGTGRFPTLSGRRGQAGETWFPPPTRAVGERSSCDCLAVELGRSSSRAAGARDDDVGELPRRRADADTHETVPGVRTPFALAPRTAFVSVSAARRSPRPSPSMSAAASSIDAGLATP